MIGMDMVESVKPNESNDHLSLGGSESPSIDLESVNSVESNDHLSLGCSESQSMQLFPLNASPSMQLEPVKSVESNDHMSLGGRESPSIQLIPSNADDILDKHPKSPSSTLDDLMEYLQKKGVNIQETFNTQPPKEISFTSNSDGGQATSLNSSGVQSSVSPEKAINVRSSIFAPTAAWIAKIEGDVEEKHTKPSVVQQKQEIRASPSKDTMTSKISGLNISTKQESFVDRILNDHKMNDCASDSVAAVTPAPFRRSSISSSTAASKSNNASELSKQQEQRAKFLLQTKKNRLKASAVSVPKTSSPSRGKTRASHGNGSGEQKRSIASSMSSEVDDGGSVVDGSAVVRNGLHSPTAASTGRVSLLNITKNQEQRAKFLLQVSKNKQKAGLVSDVAASGMKAKVSCVDLRTAAAWRGDSPVDVSTDTHNTKPTLLKAAMTKSAKKDIEPRVEQPVQVTHTEMCYTSKTPSSVKAVQTVSKVPSDPVSISDFFIKLNSKDHKVDGGGTLVNQDADGWTNNSVMTNLVEPSVSLVVAASTTAESNYRPEGSHKAHHMNPSLASRKPPLPHYVPTPAKAQPKPKATPPAAAVLTKREEQRLKFQQQKLKNKEKMDVVSAPVAIPLDALLKVKLSRIDHSEDQNNGEEISSNTALSQTNEKDAATEQLIHRHRLNNRKKPHVTGIPTEPDPPVLGSPKNGSPRKRSQSMETSFSNSVNLEEGFISPLTPFALATSGKLANWMSALIDEYDCEDCEDEFYFGDDDISEDLDPMVKTENYRDRCSYNAAVEEMYVWDSDEEQQVKRKHDEDPSVVVVEHIGIAESLNGSVESLTMPLADKKVSFRIPGGDQEHCTSTSVLAVAENVINENVINENMINEGVGVNRSSLTLEPLHNHRSLHSASDGLEADNVLWSDLYNANAAADAKTSGSASEVRRASLTAHGGIAMHQGENVSSANQAQRLSITSELPASSGDTNTSKPINKLIKASFLVRLFSKKNKGKDAKDVEN